MILKPIGIIRSKYKDKKDAPRQGRTSEEVSVIEVYEEFAEGLEGIEKFDKIIVLYWLHESRRDVIKAKPPGEEERGVFSTRSPERPNPIGFSVCKLLKVEGRIIYVKWLDAIDGTPLVDIKPFIKEIDC